MSDRAAQIESFLTASGFKDWNRSQIAGDASARRYMRLSKADQSIILMDAPDGDTRSFAQIAQLLTQNGLRAPEILAHDAISGLMLLTDLGETHFADWLNNSPQDTKTLYQTAAEILLRLESIPAPDGMKAMTPSVGADMISIVGEHYSKKPTTDLHQEMERALAQCAPNPTVLALRDFHAENLIWRPAQSGMDRVGLLDFQDAFLAPAGYDLASLLRDARRDVAEPLAEELIAYASERSKAGQNLPTAVACLSVQRNLRILGVFARLATEMKKARYLAFMPRLWGHILHDLQHPALHDLKQVVLDTIPPPTSAHLESLTA